MNPNKCTCCKGTLRKLSISMKHSDKKKKCYKTWLTRESKSLAWKAATVRRVGFVSQHCLLVLEFFRYHSFAWFFFFFEGKDVLFYFIFFSWRLITSQHFSGFCHTLTWISHGVTCIPHPDPPSHLPLHPIPLGLPRTPGPSTCLMHPTWAGDLFHYR